MRTACFIPIKANSERVKGKNLRVLNGQPLYHYICEHVKEADVFDDVFIDIAGFDFAILDMEHGPASLQTQQNNIRAAELRDMMPIIRVNTLTENSIGAALDIGAYGIQIPQVASAAEAKMAVEYARFYPKGMRGVCRFVRAADYSGMNRTDYFRNSDDIFIIVQLEGVEAVSNLDQILSVDGIDIIFIGPYDLSQSLGVPGQVDHPTVIREMEKIVCKAKSRNKVIGTFVDTIDNLRLWKQSGVQYLSYGTDSGIFMNACKELREQFIKI